MQRKGDGEVKERYKEKVRDRGRETMGEEELEGHIQDRGKATRPHVR